MSQSQRPPNPNAGSSTQPDDLRGKIVAILSNTANGCLSELGYYPGMPQELKQLQQANAALQQNNTTLFEDNTALVRVVTTQNDSLAQISGTDQVNVKQFHEMQAQIASLTAERDEYKRRSEMSRRIAPLPPDHHQLVAEINRLRAHCESLNKEYARVSSNFLILFKQAAASGVLMDPSPGGHLVPAEQPRMRNVSNPLPNQQIVHNLHAIPVQNNGQPAHRNHGHVVQQQNLPTIGRSIHSPAPNPMQYSQMRSVPPQIQAQQVRSSEGSIRRRQTNRPVPGHVPISVLQGRRQSDSVVPRHSSDPTVYHSSNLKAASVPPRPVPLANYPLTPLAFDVQTLPITPISPGQQQRFSSSTGPVLGWSPSTSKRPSQPHEVIDLTEDDVPADVPEQNSAPHFQEGTSSDRKFEAAPDLSQTEPAASSNMPSAEMPPVSAPVICDSEDGEAQQSGIIQNATLLPVSDTTELVMKRVHSTAFRQQETVQAGSTKKMRIESDGAISDGATTDLQENLKQQEEGSHVVAESGGHIATSPVAAETGVDAEPQPVEDITGESGEEDDEGPIDLNDLISAIFEESDGKEDEKTCTLCIRRYDAGHLEKPPEPFIKVSIDVLAHHCQEEHPVVWNTYYNSSAEQADENGV